MSTIAELSTDPQFTIKTVCSQTGIRAVTLRAWERRYSLLTPQRGDNQYRRYSEQDIAVLRWIKARVDSGSAISSVAQEFKHMQASGHWPDPVPAVSPRETTVSARPPREYSTDLYQALLRHQETTAQERLQEAQAAFDLNTLCLQVIIPCLWQIGAAWEKGEIRIATEHFASSFIRGRLMTLFQSYPLRRTAPKIFCGCAQGEFHEIGTLILAIMLRRDSYRVEYLGPDLPNEDLADYAGFEAPDLICLSATMRENAANLRSLSRRLDRLEKPVPLGYGGAAFLRHPELKIGAGIYLGDSLDAAVATVGRMLPERASRG